MKQSCVTTAAWLTFAMVQQVRAAGLAEYSGNWMFQVGQVPWQLSLPSGPEQVVVALLAYDGDEVEFTWTLTRWVFCAVSFRGERTPDFAIIPTPFADNCDHFEVIPDIEWPSRAGSLRKRTSRFFSLAAALPFGPKRASFRHNVPTWCHLASRVWSLRTRATKRLSAFQLQLVHRVTALRGQCCSSTAQTTL